MIVSNLYVKFYFILAFQKYNLEIYLGICSWLELKSSFSNLELISEISRTFSPFIYFTSHKINNSQKEYLKRFNAFNNYLISVSELNYEDFLNELIQAI